MSASSARSAPPSTARSSPSSSAPSTPTVVSGGSARARASCPGPTAPRPRSSASPATSPSGAGARTRSPSSTGPARRSPRRWTRCAALEEVARLAVPRLADWCAVQLAHGDRGDFETIAVAHVDPAKVRFARELQERYPPDPSMPTGVPQVLRTGRSELYPEIDEQLLQRSARDEQHLELIRRLRISSGMIVPLRARDRTLGAITFVYAESGRQYSTRELELAEELAAAPAWRSITRASTRASTAPPRRSSARCCPPRSPRSPATRSPPATSPARSATTSAATGTTPSTFRTAAWGSRSATSAAAGSSRPRSWARSATRCAPTPSWHRARPPRSATCARRAARDGERPGPGRDVRAAAADVPDRHHAAAVPPDRRPAVRVRHVRVGRQPDRPRRVLPRAVHRQAGRPAGRVEGEGRRRWN